MERPAAAKALVARWRAWPAWARYGSLYLASLALALLLGLHPSLGWGNALFLAGAVWILASTTQIRAGGHRKTLTHRDIQGRPLFKEKIVSPERETQIQRGVRMFLVGIALWAPLLALLHV